MRILVDYRPALRERTGVGEYIHESARALVQTAPADESLVLFSSSWKDRLAHDIVPGAAVADARIPVRVLNYLWHRQQWPPVEWLAGGGFDIAQSGHPFLMPSRRAARLVLVADLDFLDHPERTSAEIRRDYPTLAPDHIRRADHVVVISEHTAAEVHERLQVPRSRLSICPPGAPEWAMRDAEPQSNGYVLFLGTLEPRKNLAALLDAYESLVLRRPDIPRLVLAGRQVPEASHILERAGRGTLAGHVDVIGYVNPARRLELYRGALLFVLPSHTEGFGMPAVEAMMAGVPVVAADRGALRQSVGAGGRLFDPADPAALAMAIEEVLSNRLLRLQMSDAGRRHAEQFTWVNTARGLREAWAQARETRRRRDG